MKEDQDMGGQVNMEQRPETKDRLPIVVIKYFYQYERPRMRKLLMRPPIFPLVICIFYLFTDFCLFLWVLVCVRSQEKK